MNIKTLKAHCEKGDYLLEEKYDLKIIPYSLYPINYNKNNNLKKEKNYIASFVGYYQDIYIYQM